MSAADHEAAIRKGIAFGSSGDDREAAHGHLDALVGLLQQAEQQRDGYAHAEKSWQATANLYKARAERAEQERDRAVKEARAAVPLINRRVEQIKALEEALREVQAIQPAALERLRADNVVFDETPHHDPSNWQQIAFWIYSDLCATEMIASSALNEQSNGQGE